MQNSEDGLFREKNRTFAEIPAAYSLQMNARLRQKRYKTQPPCDPVNHFTKAEIHIQFETRDQASWPGHPAGKRKVVASLFAVPAGHRKTAGPFPGKRHSGE